jgi:hypothetical protein
MHDLGEPATTLVPGFFFSILWFGNFGENFQFWGNFVRIYTLKQIWLPVRDIKVEKNQDPSIFLATHLNSS